MRIAPETDSSVSLHGATTHSVAERCEGREAIRQTPRPDADPTDDWTGPGSRTSRHFATPNRPRGFPNRKEG